MKTVKTEDLLRQEYFDLLPELAKVQQLMDAKIRWYLKDITYSLKKHQRIEIESRIKDCNSAINALKRRNSLVVLKIINFIPWSN